MTHLPLDVLQQVVLSLFEVGVLKLHWTISLLFYNACINVHHFTESICAHTHKQTQTHRGKQIKKQQQTHRQHTHYLQICRLSHDQKTLYVDQSYVFFYQSSIFSFWYKDW